MPTLAQVKTAIDTKLADLWTTHVQTKEAAYVAANGSYWQGIITTPLASLPNNASDINPILLEMIPNLLGHPTDQIATWADQLLVLGVTIPMALAVDVYGGPLGQGYVGIVWAKWNGSVYMRAKNFGPETWRDQAWTQVA